MNWKQTYSGLAFDFDDPKVEMLDLQDIAHSESQLCRYTGHCKDFYSVAQHSKLCSYMSDDIEVQRWCLLHDAAEPYMSDVSRPLKRQPWMKEYCEYELRILRLIATKFNLVWPIPEVVHMIDNRMLATEHPQLFMTPPPMSWNLGVEPYPNFTFRLLMPKAAEAGFLDRYSELFPIRKE